MSVIVPGGLSLGSFEESFDQALLRDHGITHILNVADECNVSERVNRVYAKHGVPDDCADTDVRTVLSQCRQFIRQAREDDGCVFVHCLEGVSRSACVILAYMVCDLHWDARAALAHIRACRPIVDPFPQYLSQTLAYSQAFKAP